MAVKFASRDQDIPLKSLRRHEVYGALYHDISERRDSFVASLKDQGQQINIVVVKNSDGYDVIDGYQRWQVAVQLEWPTLRADIVSAGYWMNLTDEQKRQVCKDLNDERRHLQFSAKVKKYREAKKSKGGRPKKTGEQSSPVFSSVKPEENSDSDESAAQKAGYSTPRAAQKDAKLFDATISEVHAAIDAKEITKEEAKEIAKLPKNEQEDGLARAIAGQPIIEPKPVPRKLTTTEEKMKEGNSAIESWCRLMEKAFRESQPENPWLGNDEMAIAESQLKSCMSTLRASKGYGDCPKCDGKGCKFCRKSGWMPRAHYESNGGQKK